MKRPRQILYVTFAVLIVLISLPLLMVYREARRLEHDRALIHAIRQKDIVGVQILLRQGADPNARELPEPPGDLLQRLLALFDRMRHGKHEPPPDAPSALMLAVEEDNTPITLALLNAGAKDVNARIPDKVPGTSSSSPLLVTAAWAGNAEIVQALLAKGVDIEVSDSGGATALLAAASGNPDLDSSDTALPTSAQRAVEQRQTATVRVLLQQGASVAASMDGEPALWLATRRNNLEMALLLLEHGANPDGANPNGEHVTDSSTPLANAAGFNNLALVKALLQKGAKVERKETNSPLLYATHPDVLAFLLDHGANIHARYLYGKRTGATLLNHLVSEYSEKDSLKAIQLLLARGADVNEQDDYGRTPLMYAAADTGIETFRFLLDHGANVNIRDKDGPVLLQVLEGGNFDIVRLLLQHGADVHLSYEDGKTPLMQIAQMGDEEFARELLRRGADINARDKEGKTALHYAARDCDLIVGFLLKNGAKVNVRDKEGRTPLKVALANKCLDGHFGVVIAMLRKAGGKE
jgi:ankyrin repeat protein